MKYDKYELESDSNLLLFEFISIGSKGRIVKSIQYVEINSNGYYNLGFGDKDEETGEVNDSIITNNGDSQKVLATVVSTVYAFTEKYPKANIYVKGNNVARTRLYRIVIANNLIEINKNFHVLGLKDDKWQEFVREMEYEAFLIFRKK